MSDMSDITLESIIAAVKAATECRDSKRDAYAGRLAGVITAALDAVGGATVLEVGGHRIATERVTADCSQWGNQLDYPSHGGRALLIDRERSFGDPPDLGFFAGSNLQRQQGPTLCGETRVRPATVAVLLEVGAALPGVLGTLLAARSAALAGQVAALDAAGGDEEQAMGERIEAVGAVQPVSEPMTVAQLARRLREDDESRSDGVPVELDGYRAYDGWLTASREAGDADTAGDLAAVDRDDFAAAWEAL